MSEEKATLLIVEDDVDVADMLKAYFLVHGYDVLVANWGEDAVHLSTEHKVDLALLDIRLPDIDGFEVANRLRNQADNPDIPIIFLTACSESQFRLRGLELKAQDYITKPFDFEELNLRICNTLRRQQHRQTTHRNTSLPEGIPVDERLVQWLHEPAYSLLVFRIIHLDNFQATFGYPAAADFLKVVGSLLSDIIQRLKVRGFVGHLSDTEYVIILPENCLSTAQAHIQRRLKKVFRYLDDPNVDGAGSAASDAPGLTFSLADLPHTAEVESLAALKEKIYCIERQP